MIKAILLITLLFTATIFAQIQFATAVGGANAEGGQFVTQAADGGYTVVGLTNGFGAGDADLFLVNFTSTGSLTWSHAAGGTNTDYGYSVSLTADSGYAVVGQTASFGAGNFDLFLMKFHSTGSLEWSRAIGGTNTDYGFSGVQTFDGGYAAIGATISFGAGGWDLFLVKFDSTGLLEWSRAVGGLSAEYGRSVVQTADSGYAVVGQTASLGAGSYDLLLLKFSSTGSLEWSRAVGGTDWDENWSIIQTSDGGYAVAGFTRSFGAGDYDLFLAKFNSTGSPEWSRAVGGTNDDRGYSVIQTSDGGYAATGYTRSFSAGNPDLFLVKFSPTGSLEWSNAVGGTINDIGYSVIQTLDGGYAVAGYTMNFGAGNSDLFLVKFDSDGNSCIGEEIFPTVTDVSPILTDVSPTVADVSPTNTDVTPTVTSVAPAVTEICTNDTCDFIIAQWLCPTPCWQHSSCENQIMVGTLWSDSTQIDTSRVYFTVNPGVGSPFQLHEPSTNIDFICLTPSCDSILVEISGFAWTEDSTVIINLDSAFTIDGCKTSW